MPAPSLDPSPPPAEAGAAQRPAAPAFPERPPKLERLRITIFLLLVGVSLAAFWPALKTLIHISLWVDKPFDQYSYTLAIPFIAAGLVYAERQRILEGAQYALGAGLPLVLVGVALGGLAGDGLTRLGPDDVLSVKILALVVCCLGGFILCFGVRAFRAGRFALLFLLLSVPVPDSILDKPVTAVQHGSADVCSLIFTVAGVPYLRDGLDFSLAHTAIRVAKECSGIHSTIAIFIISLIAGHLFLPTFWKKLVLTLLALPIVCVTNGFRIAGLTLLAEYVNPSFLRGNLHREGGMGFFVLALAILSAVLHVLRRGSDARGAVGRPPRTELAQ